jgi:hypothetical protein
MLLNLIQVLEEKVRELTTSDYVMMVIIQVFLLGLFIFMVSYICKMLKKKEPEKDLKKTCILIWFISAIAWFIIAQIVWILTYVQFTGS